MESSIAMEKNKGVSSLKRISLYLLMFSYSITATMISPMLPEIISDFSLNLSQGGLILTVQSIGGMLVISLLSFFADKVKKSRLITIGFSLYIICLYLISILPVFTVILLVFLVFGAGSRTVDTLSNAYITDLFPERKSRYLNILHSIFGVGALIGPMYARFIMDNAYGWRSVFSILGLASLPLLFLFIYSIRGIEEVKVDKVDLGKKESFLQLLKNKQLWILAIVMFFYVGHQSAVMLWTPMYLEEYIETSAFIASLALSIYWIGIIISRLSFSYFSKYKKNSFLIKWTSISAGILFFIGLLMLQQWFFIGGLFFSGILTGAFIPLVIDVGSSKYAANSGSVTAILYLALNGSIMLFPWLVGLIAENISLQWGMYLAAVLLALIFFISYFIRD
ncbi:MFS transporter [Natronospora cellulosivora (SeqCode)]